MIDEFAQIVGLLSAFTSSRDSSKAKDFAEFNAWLIEHNHHEALKSINSNTKAISFVESYLNRQLPEIQSKIDILTAMVQVLIESQSNSSDEISPRRTAYVKNVLILILQRDIFGKYLVTDLDEILKYVEDIFIADGILYNRYVLKEILRETLEAKKTVYDIVNDNWHELCK